MSKFKIINLVDKIFVNCAVFLIVYAWINFYIRNLWTTFILSLIFSFAILYVLNFLLKRKNTKQTKIKNLDDSINFYYLAFTLNPKYKKLELLNRILSADFKTKLENNNLLTYESDNSTHLIIIATQYDNIDNNTLISLLQDNNLDNINSIDIVCNSYSLNINKNIFKNKEIKFITKKSLYLNFFLKYNIYPETDSLNLNKPKFNFKDFAYNLFIPNKAKSYFLCGLILILSSIILPYHYYYIIVGSVLLLFSIICRLLPKFKD